MQSTCRRCRIGTDGAVSNQPLPNISQTGQSHLPTKHSEPMVPVFRMPPAPKVPQVTLYDQLNNPGTVSTNSQDFETAFDAFDNFAADDFVVPAGQTWTITEVDTQGLYFNGPGPAASFHVFFYQDSGGLPGSNVYTAMAQPYVNNAGVFQVTLTGPPCLLLGLIGSQYRRGRMTFQPASGVGLTGRYKRITRRPGRTPVAVSESAASRGALDKFALRVQRAKPTKCSG